MLPKLKSQAGHKRLEVTMRDVLDGLEDAACQLSFKSSVDTLEILSIEPPGREYWMVTKPATVTPLPQKRSTDIVDYLISRELRHSAAGR